MTTTATDTAIHPFEAAGYGPGPYTEIGYEEDEMLGHTCDNCGKKHLRHKFILLSSTGQQFGVGSECIKKADPAMWLEMKHHYGATNNITTTKVEKRRQFDKGQALIAELKQLHYITGSWLTQPFSEVSRKQTKSYAKELEKLELRLEAARHRNDLHKAVKAAFIKAAKKGLLKGLPYDRTFHIAVACAENSNPHKVCPATDYELKRSLTWLTSLTD